MLDVAIYEGDVSISMCRALILWQPSLEDDMRSSLEEQRLEAEAIRLDAEIEAMRNSVVSMEEQLKASNAETIRQLAEYQEELNELFAQRMEEDAARQAEEMQNQAEQEFGPMPTEEQLEEMHRRFNEAHNKRMEEESQASSSVKVSDRVKKLFRKIANRTHPDKVSDPDKHAMFVAAKKAYAKDDYDSLLMIWRTLENTASKLFKAMFSRLKELQELVAAKLLSKRQIEMSEPYRMAVDYADDRKRSHVERHYRRLLDQQIKQTIAVIQTLDPKRYQPKPSLSGFKAFFVANESNTAMQGESLDEPWSDPDDDGIAS